MTQLNLSVLGLDRLGVSIGMALSKNSQDIHIVGFDKNKKVTARIESQKIFSETTNSLQDALRSADVVVISPPVDEVQPILKEMAPFLMDEAMIVYCGFLPGQGAKWAQVILPDNVFFTALTPTFNPKYIEQNLPQEPCADLFENGLIFISHAPSVPPAVADMTITLTRLLGAKPHFSDLLEVDGLQVLTNILPIISAAVVMLEAKNEPGWQDAAKLAGELYASSTRPLDHLMEQYDLGQSLLINREYSLRIIANLQNALAKLSTLISAGKSEELKTMLEALTASRNPWMKTRQELAQPAEPKKKK
jgi:prephenate dehydrogenase